MPFRRTSIDSSQRTGFYSPKRSRVVGGGLNLWNPSFTSTALWFDAADTSTITLTSNAVSQWNDKSGNNNHATQTDSTRRPIVSAAALNSLDVLTFDGSNDSLRFSEIILNDNNTTGVSVFTRSTSGINSIDLGAAGGGAAPTFSFSGYPNWWFTDNILYSLFRTPYFGTHGSASTATGSFINVMSRNSTGTQAWRNGSILGTRQYPAITGGASLANVGSTARRDYSSGNYHSGDIAEIILVRADVSDSLRQKFEGYLAHKWGLLASLPADHPYKIIAPTVD